MWLGKFEAERGASYRKRVYAVTSDTPLVVCVKKKSQANACVMLVY